MASFSLLVAATLGTASAFTPGCLIKGQRFTDGTKHTGDVPGATSCQNLCVDVASCNGFTYFPSSSECWFSASGNASKLTSQQAGVEAYSGPKVCAVPPAACPTTLTGSWPQSTVAASNAAFANGYQPSVLQCWPYNMSTNRYDTCSGEIQVLDDMAAGWEGKCQGLTQITLNADETCEAKCLADVTCPSYQVGSDGSCWQGLGEGCWGVEPWTKSWTPREAKRFQRGAVHVLKDMGGPQVLGMKNVFNKATFDAMGFATAKTQCAKSCYSVLKCQYWQLNNVSGCWIEYATPMPYPFTSGSAENGTADAANTVAGEYIQRVCTPSIPTVAPPPVTSTVIPSVAPPTSTWGSTTTTTTTTTEAAGGFPWWGWLLLALLLLCCICGIIACILSSQKPKKAKKGRGAVKRMNQPPPVQQPVPTMQIAMPVYYAAPVPAPVAAPVYTYTAPAPLAVANVPTTQTRAASLQVAPAPTMQMQQPMMNFDMLDRNGDGVITRAEFQAAQGGRM